MGLSFNLGRLSPSLFTDSSLNVGIGAAPSGSYKLEVTGTAKVSSTLLVSGATTLNSTAVLTTTQTSGNALTINVDGSSGTPTGLRIAAGFASIGSTAKLIQVVNSAGDNLFNVLASGAATFSGQVDGSIINSTSNVIRLSGNTAISLTTISSQTLIKINAAGYWGTQIVGANDQGILISSSGETYMGTSTTDKNSRLVVYGSTSDGNTYAFRCYSSGSDILFGVRTDGYINTGNYTNSPYNLVRTGRVMMVDSAGGVGYQSSTRESKTNISNLEDISFIYKLNPVSFNYRKSEGTINVFTDEYNEDLQYGLIADEVEKVNKELVFYNEKDGFKELAGVEYGKLTAVLIKAIQELNERLNKAGL